MSAFQPGARADYQLALLRPGLRPRAEPLRSYDDLACALERLRAHGLLDEGSALAFGRFGVPLDPLALLARGALIARAQKCAPGRFFPGSLAPDAGYQTRRCPVPGVTHKASSRRSRRVGSLSEKRMAQAVERHAEPAPRGARSVNRIPDSWDEYPRHIDRCWKSEGKARKAWERRGGSGLPDRRAALAQHAAWEALCDSPWDGAD